MTSPERARSTSRAVVVAAVIRRGDTVLLARRPPEKRHGGLWEFPGGKVRDDETHRDAIHRELDEELAVEVASVGELLFEATDPASGFAILFYDIEIVGEPVPLEHEELGWVGSDEIATMLLAPADRRFVERDLPR